jgi:ABC-type microcin C transport system duplicated ATPase subunit YejF
VRHSGTQQTTALDTADAILTVDELRKEFALPRVRQGRSSGSAHAAVDGVSFAVRRGKTLGLIGESGSGKTTTGLCVLRLIEPSSGRVWFDGQDMGSHSRRAVRLLRKRMQIIFQNPYASLDPRMSVGRSIAEPLAAHHVGSRRSRLARVAQLLEEVGLDPSVRKYHPQQFSGGERQRIVIARALALEPVFIVCDEPVSSLDVSIAAQIVNLLRDLQDKLGLSYLFISHDLAVVRAISDEVAVMKDGRIVESGATDSVCTSPQTDYTKRLIQAASLSRNDWRSSE